MAAIKSHILSNFSRNKPIQSLSSNESFLATSPRRNEIPLRAGKRMQMES